MTRTVVPGEAWTTRFLRLAADETRFPANDVMRSFAPMPALAAGKPGSTPSTRAPATSSSPSLARASDTPRKAVGPTWTVDERRPASICPAIFNALLIGIAYPCALPRKRKPPEAAASIPITRPPERSGPPESPDRNGVVVSISPGSVNGSPSLLMVIDWPSPVTLPLFVVSPAPPPFPTAVTRSPTSTVFELPVRTVASPWASRSLSSAMSLETL